MHTKQITLISYEHFDQSFLTEITDCISHEFSIPVVLEMHHFIDLSQFYDPARKQYNGNLLLSMINSEYQDQTTKTIGLFRVDLFIPILTYIFGQAFLNGNTGIASTFRLKNEYYGMKRDDKLLLNRFKKIIIHELGHTFGLKHCHTPRCVMISSTYVEDIDQKSTSFCTKCNSHISEIVTK